MSWGRVESPGATGTAAQTPSSPGALHLKGFPTFQLCRIRPATCGVARTLSHGLAPAQGQH